MAQRQHAEERVKAQQKEAHGQPAAPKGGSHQPKAKGKAKEQPASASSPKGKQQPKGSGKKDRK